MPLQYRESHSPVPSLPPLTHRVIDIPPRAMRPATPEEEKALGKIMRTTFQAEPGKPGSFKIFGVRADDPPLYVELVYKHQFSPLPW